MQENFRQFLDRLRQTGELVDLHQPVDIRHIATLVDQADTALYFHNVIGYELPVVSGLIRTRERSMMALGCETYREIEDKLTRAINHPIPPKYVKTSPAREVVVVGDEVDLYKLPIPMSSIFDGGPMITAGVVIARDPELGINSGIYRFIVKEKSLTGIDIVTPNNMRLFAQRAYESGRALPISISIGTHPIEITGSGYRAPLGVDEMAIAGGLRGAPVELAPCTTIDLPYVADAEIVLEAEILPTGWTWPEGRFGEFTRLMGGLHWNPLVRIKAISRRKDAIYYNLHMPWENTWLAAPTRYAAIRQALRTAGVQVKDINVTLGGCAFWHAVISIKKQPGEGKNALLAALSVMDLKHVVVVDDDIDVFDPTEVEWAIATRVQGDKDVMIVTNARAKPLDPSLPQGAGIVPTGWTQPEGRFGEFTRLMGGLHWNPLVRVKAIAMKKDAIYYNLHMPWENTWLAAPTRYAAIRQALKTAGVIVKDINVTLGGCAFWHAVISIKKQPGEGKNALLAALSVMDLKHVVVVDDDIDVFDPAEVEWAIAISSTPSGAR